jgi:heat shock protein HslJ
MRVSRSRRFLGALMAALCLAAAAQAATENLSGTSWRLVEFRGVDGQILRADEASNYTVEFRTDSTVALRLDCHRGRGTWVSRSASQLELGPLALTRATCPQAVLRDQLVKQWASVRSYALRNTHLFLSLTPDGGTYEFEPAQAVAAAPASAAQPVTAAAPPTPVAAATPAAQAVTTSWLDQSKPTAWNLAGAGIPRPPKGNGTFDPRCRALARTPELDTDKQLATLGWDLIGAYQGGWGILVIQGAAGYDGMCRPLMVQDFVFLRGVFVGTLSPETMDARSDGALSRVAVQGDRRLVAEYARYARTDALCCPSRTSTAVFEIGPDPTVVRPISVSTSSNR